MRPWVHARRGLYAIVDPAHCGARSPLEVASGILEGGCAVLQLRSKSMPDRPLLALAERLRGLARDAGVPFVLNDRPDIAKLVEADGVHLGQDDLSIEAARAVVGPEMAIGRSTHDLDQAARATHEGADYLGFGPVYPTTSKANPDAVVGVAELKAAVAQAPIPVVAIGGITPSRVAEVAATGARYWAAISALCAAEDVAAAARRMQEIAS